jgi:hypothetical protein
MVAQACNHIYSGGRGQKECSSRAALAKSSQDPFSVNEKLGVMVCTCHSSYVEGINRRIMVQGHPGINKDSILKNN